MATLFLSVYLPKRAYARHTLSNVDLGGKTVADLKNEVESLLTYPQSELELIYCGTVLNDMDRTLNSYSVQPTTTIQVCRKRHVVEYTSKQPTAEQIQEAAAHYRKIVKEMANGASIKSARSEIVRKVVDAYPELNDNLAAYGIFRDSILVQSMTTVESATKIAQEYPILIHSAEFVAKTTHAHMSANKISPLRSMESVPEDSSDSSGSEADAAPDAANQNADIRQISRDQLSRALALAGSSSLNSLSNIAQRNPQQSSAPTSSTSSDPAPATAPATAPTAAAAATAAAPLPSSLISDSFFSNALSQALASSSSSAAPTATPAAPAENPTSESNQVLSERYATELRTMHEMGLFNDPINLQALAVSNGDVETAINLVLSGLGNAN